MLDADQAAERAEAVRRKHPGMPKDALAKALPGLEWVEIELSTEEKDASSVVEVGAKAAGIGFDRLDFRVEPFTDGIGDRMPQVGDDVFKVPL